VKDVLGHAKRWHCMLIVSNRASHGLETRVARGNETEVDIGGMGENG
jgi:hypothetical protein